MNQLLVEVLIILEKKWQPALNSKITQTMGPCMCWFECK